MNLHDLSEPTKRGVDLGVGALAALSLSQISLLFGIIASAMAIVWYAVRFYDRIRYGPSPRD